MLKNSTGLPQWDILSARYSALITSHPRPTTRTAYTLGLTARFARVLKWRPRSSPPLPQPWPCSNGTASGTSLAMAAATPLAQATEGMTATWFLMPAEPSGLA